MAEALETITVTKKESIVRVELFTPADVAPENWQLVVHFETADYDSNGALVSGTQRFGSRRVTRRFGDIQGDTFSAAGLSGNVAQLAAAIKERGYAYRAADIAAEQA